MELLAATIVVLSSSLQHPPCQPPALRVNCPGPPGGKAGCLARGCCYDDTQPGKTDWCSEKTPRPSPPPPPPPTPVVWVGGSESEQIKVHASGGVSLWINGKVWIVEQQPTACTAAFTGYINVSKSGTYSNASSQSLGRWKQFSLDIVAPPSLKGGTLATRYFLDVAAGSSSSFEFTTRLPVTTGATTTLPGASCAASGAPIISFPFGGEVLEPAAWLTWRGEMTRHAYGGNVSIDTGIGTAPIVFVGDAGATALISPSNEFLTTQVALISGALKVGPRATLVELPVGYSYSVSATLSARNGVTRTVMEWGEEFLQPKYDAPRRRLPTDWKNPLNEELSYTTALGEYFDYLAWPNNVAPTSGVNRPQEALINVSKHFVDAGLPIKTFILDIWWVHNDPRGQPFRHCMFDWNPIDAYFPNGLNWLANETGAGMMPYANYLCANSSYARSGKWKTMNESGNPHGNVVPEQSHAFWTERFDEAKAKWGMTTFWNDHMAENMDQYTTTRNHVGAMRTWMKGQADAALATGTPTMWCMERASEMVQAVEFPAVTTARASNDYHPPSTNWKLGPESLLLAALGKAASKDGINTGMGANHEGKIESNPILHILTAVWTRGPVSVGDAIGETNWTILKPCCSSSGMILSPSHALKPIDATYDPIARKQNLSEGNSVVWTTHSVVSSNDVESYGVLARALAQPYALQRSELYPRPAATALLWAWTWGSSACGGGGKPAAACVRAFTIDAPLSLKMEVEGEHAPPQHVVIVRELSGGWLLLGEVAKYVPLSPARFTDVKVTGADNDVLTLSVKGAPSEIVEVVMKKPKEMNLMLVRVVVGATGVGTARVTI